MKVLFDHQIFSNQVFGGISRYFSMLLAHLKAQSLADSRLGVRMSSNHYLQSISYPGYTHLPGELRIRGTRRIMKIINGRFCRRLLSEGDYEIFHPTYYNPYFLDYIGTRPYVITVYDLIHDLFPEEYEAEPYFRRWMDLTTRHAAAIITISASTKRDLIRLYGVPAQKIFVIHLGVAEFGPAGGSARWAPPDRFVLFVGERRGYKNFDTLLEALTPLISKDKALHLVCAGGGPFSRRESKLIASSRLERRTHQVNASESHLGSLYSKAIALIYPSRYEGFGMPVLEALNSGCPVITSGVSSLPEIGGDAALYVDPEDPESIRVSMSRVIDDPNLRADLVLRGRARAKEFSWRRTAEETARVYREVIGQLS